MQNLTGQLFLGICRKEARKKHPSIPGSSFVVDDALPWEVSMIHRLQMVSVLLWAIDSIL